MLYGHIHSNPFAFRHSLCTRSPPVPPPSVAACVVKPLGEIRFTIWLSAQMWSIRLSLFDATHTFRKAGAFSRGPAGETPSHGHSQIFSPLLIAQKVQGCKQHRGFPSENLSAEAHRPPRISPRPSGTILYRTLSGGSIIHERFSTKWRIFV